MILHSAKVGRKRLSAGDVLTRQLPFDYYYKVKDLT